MYKRQNLPYSNDILENKESFFISKKKYTIEYTKSIRESVELQMKLNKIGWTEICKKLKQINYNYNPSSLQSQVKGYSNNPKDISYYIPVLILLETRT